MSSHTRLLDFDPVTGKKTHFVYDATEETAKILTETFDDPLLELAKYTYNNADASFKGDMHHVASIPDAVFWDLRQKGYFDQRQDPHLKRLKAWLNDPENRFFRVKPGRI